MSTKQLYATVREAYAGVRQAYANVRQAYANLRKSTPVYTQQYARPGHFCVVLRRNGVQLRRNGVQLRRLAFSGSTQTVRQKN